MRSLTFLIIGCGTFFYLAYMLFMALCQRSLIFPAAIRGPGMSLASAYPEGELLPVEQGRGVLLMPERLAEAPVLIIAHGNAELIVDWQDVAAALLARGCGVLLVEFPGYGETPGKAGQQEIGEAFDAAYEWLREDKTIPASRIYGLGRSIGTGVICDLSTRKSLAGLVLISPFKSIRQFARRRLLPSFLLKHPFDNDKAVAGFSGRVLIFHGLYDDVIPYEEGVALAELAVDSEFVELQSRHDDVALGSAEILDRIVALVGGK